MIKNRYEFFNRKASTGIFKKATVHDAKSKAGRKFATDKNLRSVTVIDAPTGHIYMRMVKDEAGHMVERMVQ